MHHTHAQFNTHACTYSTYMRIHMLARTHTQTHTHARTHTPTHARSHSLSPPLSLSLILLIVFPGGLFKHCHIQFRIMFLLLQTPQLYCILSFFLNLSIPLSSSCIDCCHFMKASFLVVVASRILACPPRGFFLHISLSWIRTFRNSNSQDAVLHVFVFHTISGIVMHLTSFQPTILGLVLFVAS